jgi:hypothetical protein
MMAPSPLAFNHVLCRLSVDGVEYWVDPTRNRQVGPLAELVLPVYGKALVVGLSGYGLRDVPPSPQATRVMRVEEVFRFRGLLDPVEFSVTTTYEGAEAEQQRWQNADTSPEQLQRNFLNFYARTYPGIEVKTPLFVTEATNQNQIVISERYLINHLLELSDDGRSRVAGFHAWSIDELLARPGTVLRTMPFAVPHPVRRTH